MNLPQEEKRLADLGFLITACRRRAHDPAALRTPGIATEKLIEWIDSLPEDSLPVESAADIGRTGPQQPGLAGGDLSRREFSQPA